jgi:hypothetical protein
MKLSKVLLSILLMVVASGCGKENHMQYPEAQEIFVKGITEGEIKEIYGEPNNVMDFEIGRTFYYDHESLVKSMKVGDEITAFSVNFRDGLSYSIDEIIITKR